MVLEDNTGLLQANLVRTSSNLGRDELFELEDCVSGATFNSLPFSKAIIYHDFDEYGSIRIMNHLALSYHIEHLHLLRHWEICRTGL